MKSYSDCAQAIRVGLNRWSSISVAFSAVLIHYEHSMEVDDLTLVLEGITSRWSTTETAEFFDNQQLEAA